MNKKNYYLAMLGLTSSLSLLGCNNGKDYGNQMSKNDIKEYINSIDEENDNELSYEVVSNMKTITIRAKDDYNTYLAICPNDKWHNCYDYFTGARLISYLPQEYYLNDMIYWLEEYGLIKEKYTEEELRDLILEINNTYSNSKVLSLKKGD